MRRQRLVSGGLWLGCWVACAQAIAAPVSGTAQYPTDYSDSVVSSDLRYADGRPFSAGTALLLCMDVTTLLPPEGPVGYDTNGGAAALKGGGGALGVAAAHWLFDNHYASIYVGGTNQRQWAFQYALWEIGNDFDGTVGSIDASSGDAVPATDGYFAGDPDFMAAYNTMYGGLIATLPTLAPSYRSTTYALDLFISPNPTEQHMVVLYIAPAAPALVPLSAPAWSLTLLIAAAAALQMRRRRDSLRGRHTPSSRAVWPFTVCASAPGHHPLSSHHVGAEDHETGAVQRKLL